MTVPACRQAIRLIERRPAPEPRLLFGFDRLSGRRRPMLLASIDQNCSLESTAAAIRTKDASELNWDYVATTLIDEYNAKSTTSNSSRSRHRRKKGRRGNTGSQPTKHSRATDHLDSESDTDSTIRALAAIGTPARLTKRSFRFE